jgi:hypothetical protein
MTTKKSVTETPDEIYCGGNFFRLSTPDVPQSNTSIRILIGSITPFHLDRRGAFELAVALLDIYLATEHLER